MSWGLKVCFNGQKLDPSSDLKIKHMYIRKGFFLTSNLFLISGNIKITYYQPSILLTQKIQQRRSITLNPRNLYAMYFLVGAS